MGNVVKCHSESRVSLISSVFIIHRTHKMTESSKADCTAVLRPMTSPERRKKRDRRRSKTENSRPSLVRRNSVTTSVKQQFDELLQTFDSFIDGTIPLKHQASKLKTT